MDQVGEDLGYGRLVGNFFKNARSFVKALSIVGRKGKDGRETEGESYCHKLVYFVCLPQ